MVSSMNWYKTGNEYSDDMGTEYQFIDKANSPESIKSHHFKFTYPKKSKAYDYI